MLVVSYWQNQYGLGPTDFAQPEKSVVTLPAFPHLWYEQHVQAQHISNSYLFLMDAAQVECNTASPLTGMNA